MRLVSAFRIAAFIWQQRPLKCHSFCMEVPIDANQMLSISTCLQIADKEYCANPDCGDR